jgi:hypothetical protein
MKESVIARVVVRQAVQEKWEEERGGKWIGEEEGTLIQLSANQLAVVVIVRCESDGNNRLSDPSATHAVQLVARRWYSS